MLLPMREKILVGTILLYLVLLLLNPITGCESPRNRIPPELPSFRTFTCSFPAGAKSQKGVLIGDLLLKVTNTLLSTIEAITSTATGPVRSGTSWIWNSSLPKADFIITGTLAGKGYNWDVTINGTFEPFGLFKNTTGLDGSSNFERDQYSFDIFDPNAALKGIIDYSDKYGTLSLDSKIYSLFFSNVTFETRLIIEEDQAGSGTLKAYWDNEHIWEADSMFLNLEWWNDQQNGTWETFYNAELNIPSITDEGGSW